MGLMFHWFGKFERVRLKKQQTTVGGGFEFFYCHPYLGKIPNLTSIFFQMG